MKASTTPGSESRNLSTQRRIALTLRPDSNAPAQVFQLSLLISCLLRSFSMPRAEWLGSQMGTVTLTTLARGSARQLRLIGIHHQAHVTPSHVENARSRNIRKCSP